MAPSAVAAEIVRWVDENGVTQFTDPQLATAPASVVSVHPANGMEVPSGGATTSDGSGPSFTKISKPAKKNKRGWRGYQPSRTRGARDNRRYRP